MYGALATLGLVVALMMAASSFFRRTGTLVKDAVRSTRAPIRPR